jgi:hypothetical protein
MRRTLSLDEDVAALLEQAGKSRATTFKRLVNDALREGLPRLISPETPRPFRTQPVDLGRCYYPDLDDVREVLDDAESGGTGQPLSSM